MICLFKNKKLKNEQNPFTILKLFSTAFCIAQICIIADYPFEGNANDQSENNYDGIPSNPELVNDRIGNPQSAYSF